MYKVVECDVLRDGSVCKVVLAHILDYKIAVSRRKAKLRRAELQRVDEADGCIILDRVQLSCFSRNWTRGLLALRIQWRRF